MSQEIYMWIVFGLTFLSMVLYSLDKIRMEVISLFSIVVLLLIFQNIHRYAMYFAVIFIFILSYDAFLSFFNDGRFGVGVGTFVLTLNPILLGCYTFGCHSIRHLVGGNLDCYSCSLYKDKVTHSSWKIVTFLNRRHQLFAWLSLVWVGLSDVYVRLVSMGIINDLNTWGI